MSISHSQSFSVASQPSTAGATIPSATSLSGTWVEVGNSEIANNQQFPASTSNALVAITFTAANVQSFLFVASQNCTILTNSTSSPGDTINLKAGIPFQWGTSPGYFTNPFTVNVTAFYVSCTQACTLQYKILTS